MFRKKLEKNDLFLIPVNIFEQDLKKLPGSEENVERFVWVFVQIGSGTLKNGFEKGNCFCRGGGIIRKDSFKTEFVEFIKRSVEKTEGSFLIEVEIKEMSKIIRRYFQINENILISVCRFCVVQESLEFYTERRIFKGEERREDKMKLTSKIIKQGGEKLGLSQ